MVAKKWKAMFVGIKFVIPDPLSIPPLQLKKLLPKTTKE